MPLEDELGFPSIPIPKKWIGLGIVGIIIIVILASIFYSIGPEEVGVIRRFGRYVRASQPGLHLKAPFMETLTKVRVLHVFKEEFGFRTLQAGQRTIYAPGRFDDESLMLSGDLNVAVVEWIVQYRILDPVKYLFQVRDVGENIRDISEAAMRQIVGDRSVDEVLTVGRIEIGQEAQRKLQEVLDLYQTGVQIVTVKLKDVNPPDPVKPAFNEVNEAKQEKETTINEAWQAYNQVIPKARGQAEKTISEAEGYAINRVNQAEGDAKKFVAVWEEYSKAKDVTRRRLYLETLGEILPKMGRKYIVDSEQKAILPMLSLTERGGGS
ncbi:FtsH protease activity modulator HflK [Candidatus Aerophobetes bacterium]|uniref:Protein HflK n=1 Tax=Aerophobetes bacterium TaxID=2030807 RepID=A0A523WDF6_UNCAE|nr:MAG: FtsH protease activity modulator HflK [Candidatus Aerophobetes bacterium]